MVHLERFRSQRHVQRERKTWVDGVLTGERRGYMSESVAMLVRGGVAIVDSDVVAKRLGGVLPGERRGYMSESVPMLVGGGVAIVDSDVVAKRLDEDVLACVAGSGAVMLTGWLVTGFAALSVMLTAADRMKTSLHFVVVFVFWF
jgi:hypothetical protein